MADVVRTTSEPMLGAIRLAWWRERLEELDDGAPPPPEPRLQAVAYELLPRGVRGSELIKKLKSDSATNKIPVVLISAVPHLKDLAEKCGADAYLEKPFNIDSLTNILKRHS